MAILLLGCSASVRAGDEPGRFDYWILALSWAPQYCVGKEAEPECLRRHDFVVHGLWPQHERGFPDYCDTDERLSDRGLVERMLPLMPSDKLIRHEWRRHGSCSGMAPAEYFLHVERAWRAIAIPAEYRDLDKPITTTVPAIEQRFIEINEKLASEHMALQCRGRWLREVRFCLAKDFRFRACGADVADECEDEVVVRPHRRSLPR